MPKPIPRTCLWKGPLEDGITQSLLGRFLECRERFRLQVVEGLREDEGFSRPLEFGNLWHTAEEAHLGGKSWEEAVRKYRRGLDLRYPNDAAEVMKWYKVCTTTFPIYLKYWSKHKDESKAKPILEETSFAVPYTLPSGRQVLLRGKWDALRSLDIGKTSKQGIYIKEHKTKGQVDEDGILKTVGWNLQTMLYQVALRECHTRGIGPYPEFAQKADKKVISQYANAIRKLPPGGVHYNVIRRPLADHYAIKQKKSESIDAFYRRLGEVITADSFDAKGHPKQKSSFFMRWKVEVTDQDIQTFKDHTLHPILEDLMDWWEWIKVDPFDPWRERKIQEILRDDQYGEHDSLTTFPNKVHYQSPWGVYNSLAGGFRGSFFEYLTSGRDYGLTRVTTLFPEL